MLAKLYSLFHEAVFKTKLPWEQCLPVKYIASATYSVVKDQTPEEIRALTGQLMSLAAAWKSNEWRS